jgi:hypothetical protein
MTAYLDPPGALNQLRLTELTAICRLMVSAHVRRRPRSASNRWAAKISAPSTAKFTHHQVAGGGFPVREMPAKQSNAHRLATGPAA